ncbi:hypothetical protein N7452_002669 [Penicillium brevicompactum]|uniref:Uncharacterized protein n=1 Tax=Penicillium brevicompactum TaxID=5074 RepID=A0A9W9ULR2_PENBR|nr:hypothetical protein N7452_002669 [Penicillium brevicompactum]
MSPVRSQGLDQQEHQEEYPAVHGEARDSEEDQHQERFSPMSRKISSFEADSAVCPMAEFLKGMAVDQDFLLTLSSHSKSGPSSGR